MTRLGIGFAAVFACLLAGCTVGPKYKAPDVPLTPAYKETDGWKAAHPSDQVLRGPWWEIFGDSQLNALEEQAPGGNQNLKGLEARFREARAAIRFNRASEFPTISTAPSIASIGASANRPYQPSGAARAKGDFVLPFDVSYELDFWGRVRRTVASAREFAQASAADLETAKLSIQAELALDYFELRSADAQKQILDNTVESYAAALRLTRNRYQGGAAPKSDVAQAETQLETAQVQDTDIGVQRSQYEHAIAILIGKPPAGFSLPAVPSSLRPPDIPVGVPSELLERRPDIAAAERRVAAANEQIGIARAAFFPTVMLSAVAGLEGSSITNWLNWPSRVWAVGPSAVQILFDAGRRRATSEAAMAGFDAAVADYREAALAAFQQVEDNMAALRILEAEASQQHQAVVSAQESLQLFTNRYKGGVDTYLQVVTSQTAALANERNETDIQRRRMDATVLLIKALGGGWNVSNLPKLFETTRRNSSVALPPSS
jgi:NodT family efflux transporter outer membrane factor (OMF) lipoprotein